MWNSGESAPSCRANSLFTTSSSPTEISVLSGFLLLVQNVPVPVDGILFPIPSSISMNGVSFNWYMPLTPFETVFLCMIMTQIFVLRWLDILPININNILHGDPSGRRRRRDLPDYICDYGDNLIESAFNLVRKLDAQDCFLCSICELQAESISKSSSFVIPEETRHALHGIQLFAKLSREICSRSNSTTTVNSIEPFEEAINFGSLIVDNSVNGNQTICQEKYALCPMTREDRVHYIGIILNSF